MKNKIGTKPHGGGISDLKNKFLSSHKNEKGFTLTEVLITLVVIGIVAAISLQTIYVEYTKKETITKLQKAYTTIQNAYRLSILNNGNVLDWDFSLNNDTNRKLFFEKYLSPYLNGTICQSSTGVCTKYKNKRCRSCDYNYNFTPTVILNDGTYISLNSDNGLFIQVDLNGPKKPNSYGRDIFNLQIHQLNQTQCKYNERFGFFCQWCGACQHAGGPRTREHFKGTCNSTNQTSCGGLIQADGWKISDDYPW